jgi:hypothetical protein
LLGETILGGFALDGKGDVSRLCPIGEVGLELVGKEKLTDPLLSGRSAPVSSDTLDEFDILWPVLLGGDAMAVDPKLDPRPWDLFGGGDATRSASQLAALRWDLAGIEGGILCGIAGTGGASGALGTGAERPGEGSRNVRSVIDPELPRRSNCGLWPFLWDPATELPMEEVEPLLRRVLLVCTSATDVGVVGLDRSAVAAAAADREAFESRFFRKAWAAAVVALGLALDPLRGCRQAR